MEPGSQVKALFDFETTEENELSLKAGDVVTVTEKVDAHWLRGTCSGAAGSFPVNFVAPCDTGSSKVVAVEGFEGSHEGDLTLRPGDVVEVLYSVDENWLHGRCRGVSGIFPANTVAPIETNGDATVVKAIKDNSGQLDGELTFHEGDIIRILEKIDNVWWRGELNGETGILPSVCVEVTTVEELPQAQPKARALYPFSAENDGELSFMDNEEILLIRRVNESWLEGEVQGNRGIFPTNFVEVIVDLPDITDHAVENTPNKQTVGQSFSQTVTQSNDGSAKPSELQLPGTNVQWKGKRAKVLYDFLAESGDDLEAKQGDIVTIVSRSDSEWFKAKQPDGQEGFIPVNYLQVLDKPKSPSSKRKAPAPPPISRNANGHPSTNGQELLDIDSLLEITSNKSKPTLPPKPKNLSSPPSKHLDDLLCFDPMFDGTPASEPLKPALEPSPLLQPSNLSQTAVPTQPVVPLRPDSTGSEATLPLDERSVDSGGSAEQPLASRPNLPAKQSQPGSSFHQDSAVQSNSPSQNDIPLQPSLPVHPSIPLHPSVPLQPTTVTPPSTKPPVPSKPDSLSPIKASSALEGIKPAMQNQSEAEAVPQPSKYNILASAQPFSPTKSQIRRIQSPSSPPPTKESGLLTLDDISKDFDKALDGSLITSDDPNLPPPQRHPSPNPFAAGDNKGPTSNPFSPMESPDNHMPTPLVLEENMFMTKPGGIVRDDSVASDLSDDTFFQNISVTINPSPLQFSPQGADAFKIPPPPTKGAVTGKPAISAKPENIYSKSAVPRPRGRGSASGSVSSNGIVAPPSKQEVAAFEASVEDIFSNRELEDISPRVQGSSVHPSSQETAPSMLEDDFGVVGQAAGDVAASPGDEAGIGDLLGVEGMAPERPPARKKPPPRPSPPKVAPVAIVSREDQILAHLQPQADNEVSPEEPGIELQDTLSSLQASIAEYKLEIQRGKDHQGKLQGLLTAANEEEKVEIEQQISDMTGNLQHLEQELTSLQAQLNELQPDQLQLVKKKNAEFRSKVVREILKTETLYVRDIKLCQKGFMTVLEEKQDVINEILLRQVAEEDSKTARGLELDILFGNMDEVISVAEKFMNSLAATVEGCTPEEQLIGECIMEHSSDLHRAYATYCRNHDDAIALLEKYEENPEVQEYINQGLELVRQSTNCWDLASFLIKPVQRILKYHLLMAELYKYTEEDHPDRPNIQKALTAMTDIANSINEFKRRKDLVMKYRKPGQEAISEKIGKINMHSIKKKSQRMNQKITRITGLAPQTIDEEFDKMERRLCIIEKTIKIFVTDINSYLEQLKTATSAEATVGHDISDYYASQSNLHDVNKYEIAQRHLANKLYKDYTLFIQQRVLSPLESLLNMFRGPHKLIQKRHHKLLDYDSCIAKVEKTKDKDKLKQIKHSKPERLTDDEDDRKLTVGNPRRLRDKKPTKEKPGKEVKDEKEVARKNYEAMNVQLKDEIPKLCEMSLAIFKSCVVSFIEAERDHISSTLKKLYPLLELSIVLDSGIKDILPSFETSHQSAIERQYHFTFVPNNFDKKDKQDRRLSRRSMQPVPPPNKPSQPNKNNNQSESHRSRLEKRYPADRLYVSTGDFKAKEPMELSVRRGDMVGIIKQQDPSGGGERWYVDNGVSQGFVPHSVLQSRDGVDACDGGSDEEQQQYFYAEWSFEASGPTELSLNPGDVVRLVSDRDVEGNSEWWLVDQEGRQGYVPANYLARIP